MNNIDMVIDYLKEQGRDDLVSVLNNAVIEVFSRVARVECSTGINDLFRISIDMEIIADTMAQPIRQGKDKHGKQLPLRIPFTLPCGLRLDLLADSMTVARPDPEFEYQVWGR